MSIYSRVLLIRIKKDCSQKLLRSRESTFTNSCSPGNFGRNIILYFHNHRHEARSAFLLLFGYSLRLGVLYHVSKHAYATFYSAFGVISIQPEIKSRDVNSTMNASQNGTTSMRSSRNVQLWVMGAYRISCSIYFFLFCHNKEVSGTLYLDRNQL